MRVHRVHLPGLSAGEVTVTGSDALHLQRVLRVRPGQPVTAFDGQGMEAGGQVTRVEDARVVLQLEVPQPAQVEAELAVTVATALLKGDKLATVIRQCTELGAVAFLPFISRHADVRELKGNKLERLRRVSSEAAKQSGRAVVPEVAEALRLPELTRLLTGQTVLYADPRAQLTLGEAVRDRPQALTVMSGPEGGFAEEERESFGQAGFTGVRLGARILRAETAPVALVSALLLPEAL